VLARRAPGFGADDTVRQLIGRVYDPRDSTHVVLSIIVALHRHWHTVLMNAMFVLVSIGMVLLNIGLSFFLPGPQFSIAPITLGIGALGYASWSLFKAWRDANAFDLNIAQGFHDKTADELDENVQR